jgi:hypothetical protein
MDSRTGMRTPYSLLIAALLVMAVGPASNQSHLIPTKLRGGPETGADRNIGALLDHVFKVSVLK